MNVTPVAMMPPLSIYAVIVVGRDLASLRHLAYEGTMVTGPSIVRPMPIVLMEECSQSTDIQVTSLDGGMPEVDLQTTFVRA